MILNLTQHTATNDQIAAGVVDLDTKTARTIARNLITFCVIPSHRDMIERAQALADICHEHEAKQAMIGGAPFFMPVLDRVLRDHGIQPLYAFSRRDSVEEKQSDGRVAKRNVFRHLGFVEAK